MWDATTRKLVKTYTLGSGVDNQQVRVTSSVWKRTRGADGCFAFPPSTPTLSIQVGATWTGKGIVSVNMAGDLTLLDEGSTEPKLVLRGAQKSITAGTFLLVFLFLFSFSATLASYTPTLHFHRLRLCACSHLSRYSVPPRGAADSVGLVLAMDFPRHRPAYVFSSPALYAYPAAGAHRPVLYVCTVFRTIVAPLPSPFRRVPSFPCR